MCFCRGKSHIYFEITYSIFWKRQEFFIWCRNIWVRCHDTEKFSMFNFLCHDTCFLPNQRKELNKLQMQKERNWAFKKGLFTRKKSSMVTRQKKLMVYLENTQTFLYKMSKTHNVLKDSRNNVGFLLGFYLLFMTARAFVKIIFIFKWKVSK